MADLKQYTFPRGDNFQNQFLCMHKEVFDFHEWVVTYVLQQNCEKAFHVSIFLVFNARKFWHSICIIEVYLHHSQLHNYHRVLVANQHLVEKCQVAS